MSTLVPRATARRSAELPTACMPKGHPDLISVERLASDSLEEQQLHSRGT
jgi:hypothetical protein